MRQPLVLETPRLLIRFPRQRDYLAWRQARDQSRGHLQPWEPEWGDWPPTKRDWQARLKVWRTGRDKGRAYSFLLVEKETGALLGGITLTNVRLGPARTATLGYWLSKQSTGQGYMTEAVEHVCQWAKKVLKLARIEAGTLPENGPSRSVLERCGFREEGYAQSYLQIAGERRAHVLYGLILAR